MSPFSMAHIIDQVVREEAERLALEARQRGAGGDVPASLYIERIADRLGVTKRMLYRYMEGSTSPSAATLLALCRLCHTTLPWEWGCRELDLGYYRRAATPPLGRRDLVGLVAGNLRETAEAVQCALKCAEDGEISVIDYRAVETEIDEAQHYLTTLKSELRARCEAALRR